MSQVASILAELSRRGIRVERQGDGIKCTPARKLDDRLSNLIIENKGEILIALSGSALYEPDIDGTVTIIIALSGRIHTWPKLKEWLENQTFDKNLIRLLLCDSSQDEKFTSEIKKWLLTSEYKDIRILPLVPDIPGLADANRSGTKAAKRVHEAVMRIYNRAALCCDSQYVLFLEDDIVPLSDVIARLIHRISADVAAVCAPYRSRVDGRYFVWSGERDGSGGVFHMAKGTGLEQMRGSGFGCLLVRSDVLKENRFGLSGNETWFDVAWFRNLPSYWKRLVDWSLECAHLHNTPAPVSQIKTRHLIYHIAPFSEDGGKAWRANVDEILKRIDLFNGRRIIAIATEDSFDNPQLVKDCFKGHEIEFIERPNSKKFRDNATFLTLLEKIASPDPTVAVFYAHAKGVWCFGDKELREGAVLWRNVMYQALLDNWPKIDELLIDYSIVGTHRRRHENNQRMYPDGVSSSPWHFSGTFFWLKSINTFSTNRWKEVWQPTGWGAESWAGRMFDFNESACVAFDGCDDPYNPETYNKI